MIRSQHVNTRSRISPFPRHLLCWIHVGLCKHVRSLVNFLCLRGKPRRRIKTYPSGTSAPLLPNFQRSKMRSETKITIVSTTFSIVGCLLIFIAHRVWTEFRSSSRNILLYITAADLMTATGYFIGFIDRDKAHYAQYCAVQSFITTFSSMVSFFWTCCLALYLHAIAVNANAELGRKIVTVFHFLSWPVPLLISVAAITCGVLGESENIGTAGWCWIAVKCDAANTTDGSCSRTKPVLWMLFAGKFWEIISYFLIMISYMRIWWHVRKRRQQVSSACYIIFEFVCNRLPGVHF